MIYLFIDNNKVKLLLLKKTILSQYESGYFEKKHEMPLLAKGAVINIDLLASAIKEALSSSPKLISEKDVFLILPQETFYFIRCEVPADIAPQAISSFIKDKARSQLPVDVDETLSDYFILSNDKQKVVNFFALRSEIFKNYQEALSLIDLKIRAIIPDILSYFKLFEKTLRQEKKENIFYVHFEKESLFGYLYDTFGLLDSNRWAYLLTEDKKVEEILKEKSQEFEQNKNKLNRIILSGDASENIRQDTFTKKVGVWTNPLKRIIATFYKEYLKLLIVEENKPFPLLNLDVCFGAFIFEKENKDFSLMKKGLKKIAKEKFISLPSVSLPKKEILIFITFFALSFLFFVGVSDLKFDLSSFLKMPPAKTKLVKPPPTKIPTPRSTPSIKKEELKIKVLNGSGVSGKATDAKNILKDRGYGEILTGNAESYDYEKSELQIKKSKAEAASIIALDLKDYLTSFKVGNLSEKEAADVVIIVGKDFK